MESLLFPIILLSAGEGFGRLPPSPRGKNTLENFNKNEDCILLIVKVYLSSAAKEIKI